MQFCVAFFLGNGSLYMFDDLSPEETRLFIRLCKLVSGVAPWAVRSKFDKIFPPEMFPENVPQYIKDELYRDEIKRLKWTKIEEKGDVYFHCLHL